MSRFCCVYYQTEAGRQPVREFVDLLHSRSQHKFFNVIGLLEEYGKHLPQPHAQVIKDGVYELRFLGIEGQVRIFYFFFDGAKIVLTNGFIKKTQKTPVREIDTARQRRRDYLARKQD